MEERSNGSMDSNGSFEMIRYSRIMAFTRAALETTPSEITFFTPRVKALRETTLLMMKSVFVPSSDSGIFFIHAKYSRGFQ